VRGDRDTRDSHHADLIGGCLQREVLDEIELVGRLHDRHAEIEILDPQALGVGVPLAVLDDVVGERFALSVQYGPSKPIKACTFDAPMVRNESSAVVSPVAGMPNPSGISKSSASSAASRAGPVSPSATSTVCTLPFSKAKLPVM
jgi:hypothetical protein